MNAKQLLFPLLLGSVTAAYATPGQPLSHTSGSPAFVENKGQVTDQHHYPRPDIDYRLSAGNGLNIFLGTGMLDYVWVQPMTQSERQSQGAVPEQEAAPIAYRTYRMEVRLVGANAHAEMVQEQKQDFYERYYTSQFGAEGAVANSYQKITYKEVYPHIDWVLYVKGNTVEYDFVVRPGGKVSDIKLQYGGATKLHLNKDGSITATTPMGSITEAAPVSFRQADGKRISSAFILDGNVLGFSTGAYEGTLVIDPTLSWATYYGDVSTETIRNGCVAGDKYGNGYFGGTTGSTANIATTGSYMDTIAGSTDAFLVKFDISGSRQWATYFGGTLWENTYALTCDSTGDVYLSGYTESTSGIATTGAYQTTLSGSTDAFVVKFDTAGVRQWGSYFGGTGIEQCYGVTCDQSNNVYITGYTQSSGGIASAAAHQTVLGGSNDAFIAKFGSNGSFKWASYYGGTLNDFGYSLASDQNNNIYLTGYTRSTNDIATTGAFQTSWNALDDAFLVKFDSGGVRQWATYFGGSAIDRGYSVCTDRDNNVYIGGNTASTTGIATTGSAQSTHGGGLATDAYLVKFSPSGTRLWGTYYGGTAIDDAASIAADPGGKYVYLFGRTASSGLATSGAWKDTLDGTSDALLVKFDTAGSLQWATYFGGEATEIAYGVYCNPFSQVFIGGQTVSTTGLATSGSFQSVNAGNDDGFFALFNDCIVTNPPTIFGSDTVCRGQNYIYTTPLVSGATSYTWTLPSGWSGSSTWNSISINAGSTSDTIRVKANFYCGVSADIEKVITVSPLPVTTPSGSGETCAGDTVTIASSTGTSYQWLKNGIPISGATGTDYEAYASGSYSVVVTNDLGCTDTSDAYVLTVNPLPVPVITASGTTLSTGTYSSYQWQLNGTDITGAINPTYTMVTTTGTYTVTVTDSNGCTATSAPYSPTTGIHQLSEGQILSVYPNPFRDLIFIKSDNAGIRITLNSIDGRFIMEHKGAGKMDVSRLTEGIYLLRIYDKDGNAIGAEKFIKSNTSY